ncbi:MAG: hypothetical protein PF638_13985 [Candidatus Delongbacteria bacterium]|jgi:hypothetical protein|nr:hypothetical protein [Candidatus Delongbacteria bacterium]
MKKMMTMLLGILLVAGVSNAAQTSNGEVAANIGLTTAITVAAYPTNVATGTPAPVTAGAALGATLAVDDIVIDDNSIAGWTLDVASANGGDLINATDGSTMAYELTMANIGVGTLGTGLTLNANTPITFGAAAISATGTATTATAAYTFDLNMTIAVGETTGKLAGDYTDTVSFTLASND